VDKNVKTKVLFAVKTIVILLMICGFSISQEKKAEQKQAQTEAIKPSVPAAPVVDDGAVKVFLDKIEIEGRLEKPQAVFIIPGTNPEIDDINIERAFFNEIFRPMEKKGRAMVRPTAPGQDRKDVIPW
jgi:hypothetical protein